ncbi:hypothetical protein Q4488_01700 [Amphritea sp. 1_MG-2023]|uniref:hypothetical protein n=1 Tax=Amphritea sp. 1_MG-2023 TaxID=3062670 RepID=UPI0026E30DE3|nr:hypothetical protein [Amphritea sp. 1_MG-2023]MDO6562083.1 hypothetical protein [Amphritea sp. 1_MG-2023]
MDNYNPNNSITAQEWLALDEAKQIELISDFHAEFVKDLPDDALMVHSSIHVIVENQLAMGVDLIPETIAKLIRQGG